MAKTKIKGYSITDQYVTVNYNSQTHMVPRTDALADKLIAALREKREDDIPNLISVAKRISNFSDGLFKVKNGKIYVDGQEAPKVLGEKILKFSNEGLPYEPLVKFARNLQQNPSFRSVQELFGFLEKNDHPITEEGNFIAYKRVLANLKDIHSGTMDNSPGLTVEVPRNQVDEDSNKTCSHGLHVANWDYAHNHFGSSQRDTDVMLEVEVNPADVVAIPADYNNSKMRVCKYVVLGLIDREHSSDTYLRKTTPVVVEDDELEEEDDYEEEEEMSCDHCGDEIDELYHAQRDVDLHLCDECAEEYDEETSTDCGECGERLYDGTELCEACEDDLVDEEEDEEDDEYPWNDELDY